MHNADGVDIIALSPAEDVVQYNAIEGWYSFSGEAQIAICRKYPNIENLSEELKVKLFQILVTRML